MDAVRANQGAFHLPVEFTSDPLQVRTPGTLGFIVGVANAVTDGPTFTANGTDACHEYYSRILSMISVVEKPFK